MDDASAGSLTAATEQPEELSWRGCAMEEIHRYLNEFELDHVSSVRPSDEHTVLHHFPIRAPDDEPPRPLKGHHKWDAQHVRMPCSAKSQYPVTAADGSSSIEPRWQMIEEALLRPITSTHELQAAILTYNSKYDGQWNFRALHRLFEEDLDESESRVFFEDLLPRIVRLALRLPELVQAPIPLLRQGHSHAISLTQQQIACLLANAFLCTFPRRNTLKRKSEYSTFPDINFNRLFQSSGRSDLEKIKCICHYFRRVCPTERDSSNVPTGVVTFERRSLHHSDMPQWQECGAPLGVTPLHITAVGTIEDQGMGLLQVDFANKYLGGGVLGSGCVQEEIRFVICPELLISKLFTECLRPTEAVLMVGAERYSNYTGYASTFEWAGNHEDCTPRDSSRRRMTHIVAIDALAFVQTAHQYREELMLRELNKAYVGFLHLLDTPAPGVASGNWGCGAFGGEAALKALLQLMACTVAKRPLVYYTFGNAELRDEVHRMHTFFIEQNVRVCELWATLRKYKTHSGTAKELYNYIYKSLGDTGNKLQHSLRTQKTASSTSKTTSDAAAAADSNPVPTCSTAAAARKARDCSPEGKNKSRDLFASSSSSSASPTAVETENDANCKAATPPISRHISLSDDSETDELLLAAVGDTPARKCGTHKSAGSKTSATDNESPTAAAQKPTTPGKELRQRTLLEMLDRCYTADGGQQPASKRHCNAKEIPKQ